MNRFENDDYDTWAAQKYDEAVESWCLMADEAHERIGANRVDVTEWALKNGITVPVIFEQGLCQHLLYAGDYQMSRIAILANQALSAAEIALNKGTVPTASGELLPPVSASGGDVFFCVRIMMTEVMSASGESMISLETFVP